MTFSPKTTTILSIGVLASVLVLGAWVMSQFNPHKRIEQFDAKGTITLFSNELAQEKNLSKSARQQAIHRFSKALITAVKDYATKHHVVVLVAPSVVAGATDATQAIQAQIAKIMREQEQSS